MTDVQKRGSRHNKKKKNINLNHHTIPNAKTITEFATEQAMRSRVKHAGLRAAGNDDFTVIQLVNSALHVITTA